MAMFHTEQTNHADGAKSNGEVILGVFHNDPKIKALQKCPLVPTHTHIERDLL